MSNDYSKMTDEELRKLIAERKDGWRFAEGIAYAYDKMIRTFHAAVVGKVVRGRKVGGIEVLIDTMPDRGEPRYFIHLVFTEKQYGPEMSQQERLLRVVFDESPAHAWRLFELGEFLALLLGVDSIEKYEWTLEDETPPAETEVK